MNEIYEPEGVLIVNKHKGPTSHDIVNMIRKLYRTKKVGHTGTLDPMATGVLVVLIGRAAKAAEFLVTDEKKYRAVLKLGIVTDTEDTTGNILYEHSCPLPQKEKVFDACSTFLGKSEQIPPMYSALKVDGKKLVDLARKGEEIERSSRPIEIFSIKCEKKSESEYYLDVHCSSGTYIRTLCKDIGEKLGCGGTMAELQRLETGGFSIKNSYGIDELKEMNEEQLISALIPTESLFISLPKVCLPQFYDKLCRSGCEIYQKKIKTDFSLGERVRICSQNGDFFALGEIRSFGEETAIKAIKLFKL